MACCAPCRKRRTKKFFVNVQQCPEKRNMVSPSRGIVLRSPQFHCLSFCGFCAVIFAAQQRTQQCVNPFLIAGQKDIRHRPYQK